ncbi:MULTISPECIES: thiol-disulfide oxidoreductase-associated membrane protein CcdA2 [unclassified Streptococcus]|uniref:thiol-disulfide oxidoreductase-associated membrane protein CcdA2 n=1 Tax=unclassified Streptococcus TaxID=2608887 RepID=UPI001072CF71|nr:MULTISPECIES: thiol-disulfide oxidoreductase-associated membrane protein CcdA2 [unclassified Streptococcus]MBF0786522.1 thiol-disulfide oxidoreductase-associated membrane protein CcdA2 [Streptococcus sp. 19428wC2_LYSM12]MCQ9212322.1 thiol-disulfide oxidoreductase-associated membrane protein CcdA2 [Streptococcus sp. B01]MCQ9213653.1 thiol-disulfide oxidoreductase-associated membrane protein CcdA2 [Streptococcus sp. O1]TFV06684.1 cytochrome c biogenesis protein CcdA [Streptococcus sp. LYSM12]
MTSVVFLLSVFLAGILSFFSPCILPLLPVYVGVLLDADEPRTVRFLGFELAWYGIVKTLFFIAGLSMVFVTLGYGAGFLGNLLYTDWFRYVLGAIVIVLGIHQMGIITIAQLQKQKSVQFKQTKKRNDFYNAFLLGLTFSFGWTPCVGPVLSSVLAIAASGGDGAWQGAILMLVYTLGLAIPFLLVALASSFVLRYFSKLKPYLGILKKIGGALIVLMGILLMLGNVNIFAQLFG